MPINLTIVLKKFEPNSDQRERGDILFAYITGSLPRDYSTAKFDLIHITNFPDPHINFLANLTATDHVGTGQVEPDTGLEGSRLRNSRCHYIDEDELPPPKRTELINDGVTTMTWGQVRQAMKSKSDLISKGDNLSTRQGKSTALIDSDVTINSARSRFPQIRVLTNGGFNGA